MRIQFIALFFLVCFFQQGNSIGWSPFQMFGKTYDSQLDAEVPQMLKDMKLEKVKAPLVGDVNDEQATNFTWNSENRV
jgi:hypothetical protein